MNQQPYRLAGAYEAEEDAVAAVKQLQDQGFKAEEIAVIGEQYASLEQIHVEDDTYQQQIEEGKTLVFVDSQSSLLQQQKQNPGEAGLERKQY
ncbi:general stress protein [Cytobacillus gottheilii]|uniref:general stress protein n=1 Tax=Cytobacillus gottheilii TaxID=859144 RepID=UPI0009B9D06D|nr:general stress protein [Cytobacillus gottheilii]